MKESLLNQIEEQELLNLSQSFRKYGFVKVTSLLSSTARKDMRQEAEMLLHEHSERRDLHLETTNFTPRYMSVITSETISENSQHIRSVYENDSLVKALETIACEKFYPCPSKDEEFLISRHEKKGDTHGWHWGDYSFALIWVLETPDIEIGGLLQCVPHTNWNKKSPKINHYLSTNEINTYSFKSGDVYLLKTDTTLHRTIPLSQDATRVMLNMTWGNSSASDLSEVGIDRWWENKDAPAAIQA
jgi:hypothetical protein